HGMSPNMDPPNPLIRSGTDWDPVEKTAARECLSSVRAPRQCASLGNSRAVGPAGTGRLPLPREVVADVGVAVGRIKPQAPVNWKRVIKLVDLCAGVIDGRWNVDTRRWLGQRQRWRA